METKVIYDQDFIDAILNHEIDSYGSNSEVNLTIEQINNGKEKFFSENSDVVQELISTIQG
jgi:hypothetical protein